MATKRSTAAKINQGLRTTRRVAAKLTAALAPRLEHNVTGRDATGKVVATERGDRSLWSGRQRSGGQAWK